MRCLIGGDVGESDKFAPGAVHPLALLNRRRIAVVGKLAGKGRLDVSEHR